MIETREAAVVMPVVLLKAGTHEEAIAAVATAALSAYRAAALGDPAWEAWLAHDEGKTVRRANEKDFTKIAALGGHLSESTVGATRAIAFAPTAYNAMPSQIRRLQVGGTDFPREVRLASSGSPTVYLNAGLGMSTGKSCAQAAHALIAWWRFNQPNEGAPIEDVRVQELGSDDFDRVASVYSWRARVIRDAGHTEIEPGSATAFVIRP